jgi:hypothetical protein
LTVLARYGRRHPGYEEPKFYRLSMTDSVIHTPLFFPRKAFYHFNKT